MSERERWVVYPLLFLTLGVAMRDKMLKRVDTDAILAERVISAPLTVSHTLRADEVICGRLVVQSQSGRPAVAIAEDRTSRSGRVETYDVAGKTIGVLGDQQTQILPAWLWRRIIHAAQEATQEAAKRQQQPAPNPPADSGGEPEPEGTE